MNRFFRRLQKKICLPLPLVRHDWWVASLCVGILSGVVCNWCHFDLIDTRLYDHIVAQNSRPASLYTARVVLDDDLPLSVTLTQATTLEALAAERLIKIGAKAVLLDAQFALRNYRKENFLTCLPLAETLCTLHGAKPCLTENGRPRHAPLDLDDDAVSHVFIPEPLSDTEPPAYDLLFGDSNPHITLATMPTSHDGVLRDAYADGNAVLPAMLSSQSFNTHRCDDGSNRQCMAIRYSESRQSNVIELSKLANCDPSAWQNLAAQIKGRYVVLQMASLKAPDDVHVTPLFSSDDHPGGLQSGSKLIADSIETSLENDAPRSAPVTLLCAGILLSLILVLFSFAYLRILVALCSIIIPFALAWYLSPLFAYPYAVWPATACLTALMATALTVLVGHMWLNTRNSGMLARFMPPQVRHLLLLQRSGEFNGREVHAVVLMSDLAGYTTITSLLPSPSDLFALINRYLDKITAGLQEKYGAWLDSYVGDMIFYYWPQLDRDMATRDQLRIEALSAAIDIINRQHLFFEQLPSELPDAMSAENREQVRKLLFAGMAITEGDVFMGEIGPGEGIRKFGILGDPINLASRLEAQTRHFNTNLIVTSELVFAARELGLNARRLAVIRVKGRIEPVMMWALHQKTEPVSLDDLAGWENWRNALESRDEANVAVPACFQQDATTLSEWCAKGLWNSVVGCFELDTKQ